MGKVVTVIGIDGSGKSTFINKTGFKSFHFYSGVKKSSKSDVKRKSILSVLKFFIGTILKIYIPNLLIFIFYKYFTNINIAFDRYAYDYLIGLKDQKKAHKKLLYFLFFYFPTPDHIIFLKVEPEVAYERKKEFNIQYLYDRQKKLMAVVRHINHNKLFIADSLVNIEKAYEIIKQ